MTKINVTENIAIVIQDKEITVENELEFDMFIDFVNRNQDQSLDQNGDLFEPVYRCFVKAVPKFEVFYASLRETKEALRDLQEIKKFFEFVDNNKKNLFETAGFKGVVE